MNKERLVTANYCYILAANFLLYFGFYLLMPVLPFYLTEVFQTDKTVAGLVLACYTLAALTIRPFSGYLLDSFARKPLYLFAFFIFTGVFAGYLLAGTLTLFTILRILHGFSFGTVTVSGNTIVIDIMPASRRGEGLGYYGLSNNIAMAVGPMTGLFLHDYYTFDTIFLYALASCTVGLIMATLVKTPVKPPVKREPISLDRFILLKGIPVGFVLLLLSIPYGMTTTYVAMYAHNIGITGGTGLFFTLMALGMATSRLFSGKQVDRGWITQVITFGMCLVCVCFFTLSACHQIMEWDAQLGTYIFFGIALFLGIGFGTMFPAFNTMFVNLAPNNQRGTATSTYLTSWDVGIGLGLVLGGYIANVSNFQSAYFIGACLTVVSMVWFVFKITPYYHKNKLPKEMQ
ncbi:MFS transporter [Porphyromonadaceae bacterium OttesenSCG-928-L07]|nr:MFS transporter [Porphyromonadaceae bacterium OttesenSCG-928-L07]MDL2330973.1 MFS transporter [Odoribacter sp. OttesenSCG-928-A06]